MKLSRYTFLASILVTATLVLAGCGSGDDGVPTPPTYDPVPVVVSRASEVLPSPDRKFEAVTYSVSPTSVDGTARKYVMRILYRLYGQQDSAKWESYEQGEWSTNLIYLEGRDEFLFWSPDGNKLLTMTSRFTSPGSTKPAPRSAWTTVLSLKEPRVLGNIVEVSTTDYSTDVLAAYSFGSDENTRFYPTGFSADGNSLLYTREVKTDQGVVTTKYAFNYRTKTNTEVK